VARRSTPMTCRKYEGCTGKEDQSAGNTVAAEYHTQCILVAEVAAKQRRSIRNLWDCCTTVIVFADGYCDIYT